MNLSPFWLRRPNASQSALCRLSRNYCCFFWPIGGASDRDKAKGTGILAGCSFSMPASVISCIDRELVRSALRTVHRLRNIGATIVTAESCTAGLISAVLAQAEGASEVLQGSFVVYSKNQKHAALGVDVELLSAHGAVNADVAEQMLSGALARSKATLGLAVTGVLGPEEDEDGNPVGLVIFCVGRAGESCRTETRSYGNRPHEQLQHRVVLEGLELLESTALSER